MAPNGRHFNVFRGGGRKWDSLYSSNNNISRKLHDDDSGLIGGTVTQHASDHSGLATLPSVQSSPVTQHASDHSGLATLPSVQSNPAPSHPHFVGVDLALGVCILCFMSVFIGDSDSILGLLVFSVLLFASTSTTAVCRLVSEMCYYVSSGKLNCAHSLTIGTISLWWKCC